MVKHQWPSRLISRMSIVVIITLVYFISSNAADDSNSNSKIITDDASTLKTTHPSYNTDGTNGTDDKTKHDSSNGSNNHSHHGHQTKGLVVASWNYHEIRDPLIFTAVLVLAGICKIVYHHSNFLSTKIPESCILIVLGIMFGALIHFTGAEQSLPTFFNPHEFFIYLLPPIILEAAFSLHDRTFIENLGSILLFAVVGTVLACGFVGLSLFGLAKSGAMGPIRDLGFVELMVFASLIVAVDPVAVLAVFNEIGVNHVLYFLVFGESLLNDGVTVVLYKVFQAYNVMDEITAGHVVLGFVKFFVVCLGGGFLGVLAGVASAIFTKYATHVKVAQPLIIYTMAYLGFLCAELFEFSGIICIVACGITQKQYAFNNISDKSRTTINYFTKVISTACETIIFMFLGLSVVTDSHDWDTGFTLWTILLCNLYRFTITFGLSFLINRLDSSRVRKISLDEQFMIAYGGLRGAVCFSLVALLNPIEFPAKNMFVTTTLTVIFFTVFLQGITIKPLVYLLQITLAPEKSKSMYKELHEHVTDHLMAGIEDIIGDHGKNHLREKMQYWDAKYFQPFLLVTPDPCDVQLKEFYDHLILKEHYDHMKASNATQMEQMPSFLRYLDDDGVGKQKAKACESQMRQQWFESDLEESNKIGPSPMHSNGYASSEEYGNERPHITTELFLKGLLSPPSLEESGMIERAPTVTVDEPSADIMATGDDEVVLRNRGSRSPRGSKSPRSSRSPSHEKSPSRASTMRSTSNPSSPDVTNARELRVLLKQNTNSRIARYDRNLTVLQDFQSELRKKSGQNRRMRRFSTPDGLNPKLVAQQSWCESDSDITAQRRFVSNKDKHSGPRHAATVDFQNQGRRATIDPVFNDNVMFNVPPSSPLYSVHEENEEADKTGLTSDYDFGSDNDNESHPMIPGEGQEERRARLKKRKGRQSTKHRLERQGGMDTQAGDTGEAADQGRVQDVPMKNLAGTGGGDVEVKIEDGSGGGGDDRMSGEDTSKM